MRKPLRIFIILLVLITVVLALAACGQGSRTPGGKGSDQGSASSGGASSVSEVTPEVVRIGASSMGGNYYVAAGAIGSMLEKKGGMKTSVMVTAGGRNNAVLADQGKIELGLANTLEAFEEFSANSRTNMRSLVPLFSGQLHFVVREDTGISSLRGLEGASISIGPAGSTHDAAARAVLDILGIKAKVQNTGKEDAVNLVKDRRLHGLFLASSYPIPAIQELAATTRIRVLPFSDAEMDKVIGANPAFSRSVIPANTYNYQHEDVPVLTSWNILITNKDLAEGWAYQVVDLIYKNKADLVAAMEGLKDIDPQNLGGLAIPLHRGAVRWYQEHGFQVPRQLIPPEYAQ